jgi:hypothetical protein
MIKKEDPTICCSLKAILLTEINTGLGQKAGRRFINPMAPENRHE